MSFVVFITVSWDCFDEISSLLLLVSIYLSLVFKLFKYCPIFKDNQNLLRKIKKIFIISRKYYWNRYIDILVKIDEFYKISWSLHRRLYVIISWHFKNSWFIFAIMKICSAGWTRRRKFTMSASIQSSRDSKASTSTRCSPWNSIIYSTNFIRRLWTMLILTPNHLFC